MDLLTIPAPRTATTSAEVGRTGDSTVLHAARKTLAGQKALCGAGSLHLVPGRFDPTSADSCTECLVS